MPFKIGGAVIDAVTPDDLTGRGKLRMDGSELDSDDAGLQMESAAL